MDILSTFFETYWTYFTFIISIVVGVSSAIHATMTKRDVRSAIGWVGITLFSPILGSLLYFVIGINQIRKTCTLNQCKEITTSLNNLETKSLSIKLQAGSQFLSLRTLGDQISHFQLTGGNTVQPLSSGEEAYLAILHAVRKAQHTIALQSYIFDNDAIGLELAKALIEANARKVEVRVLIDAIGACYSSPSIIGVLKRGGVRTERFMSDPITLFYIPYANLRSHRKILVVDGKVGFSGGMNLRAIFMRTLGGKDTNSDTHFKFTGPIVNQFMSVFTQDWYFTSGEKLPASTWFNFDPPIVESGVTVRCVPSGPNHTRASTHSFLLGALAVAQRHVRIQSPYFLPDQALIGALVTTALRGITVDIVIPGSNNLRLVNYAMTAQLDQVIRMGCRVWRATGTFNHSKLMTIDGEWSYVGSSNLDPRSLYLNFELDTEIYSRELAKWIENRIDTAICQANRETLASLGSIPFFKQLRNKVIWLISPYL